MKIWLVTIGEPVPVDRIVKDRLHRSGYFSFFLAAHKHKVTWWTSTFDHFGKHHLFFKDTDLNLSQNLNVKYLYGIGYKRNISIARMRDHKIIARKFRRLSETLDTPDLIISSFPTIELSMESVNYGKKHHVPVILDVRDMWPDIFVDHVPNPLRPLARILAAPMFSAASKACAEATAITGITEAFVDWGLAKAKRRRSPWDKAFPMGYSAQPPAEKQIKEAESFWDNVGISRDTKDFIICFIGTIGRQFDLDSVIAAARKISHSGRQVRLVLCGTGDRLEHFRKSAADLSNILFPGWVDAAKIFVLMRRSAVGLDPLPDRYDFIATINNKAIEYMSAGLPIISSPDRGVLCELLSMHGCGISYPTGDADALVATLARLYDDREKLRMMSQNALRLFQEKFTAEKVYTEMMEHLVKIAENEKRNPAFRNCQSGIELKRSEGKVV